MSTTVPPPSTPGVQVLPFHFDSVAADAVAALRFKLPFPAKVLGFSAAARARANGDNTLTANLKAAGTSLLSAPVAVAAGSTTEATIAGTGRIADEGEVTVDFDIAGTTPSFSDVTLLITIARV